MRRVIWTAWQLVQLVFWLGLGLLAILVVIGGFVTSVYAPPR